LPSPRTTLWRVWSTSQDAENALDTGPDLRPVEILEPGHEVELDEVLKYTKDGKISRDSIAGKLATYALELGGEVKAGKSRYFSGDTYVKSDNRVDLGEEREMQWIECALNGERIRCSGTEIRYQDMIMDWKQFLDLHTSGKAYWDWYFDRKGKK
jgi:hypothetical protein